MAKSKPIGVRFDTDKLEMIQKEQNLTSAQQVVNYLMDNYGSKEVKRGAPFKNMPPFENSGGSITVEFKKLDKIAAKLDVSKSKADVGNKFYKEPVELTLNRQPEPPAGLTGIDLTIWKSENWK